MTELYKLFEKKNRKKYFFFKAINLIGYKY